MAIDCTDPSAAAYEELCGSGAGAPITTIGLGHVVVLTAAFVLTTLTFGIVLHFRSRRHRNSLRELPKELLPVSERLLGAGVFKAIMAQFARVSSPDVMVEPPRHGAAGWVVRNSTGGWMSMDAHRRLYLCATPGTLEQFALKRSPALKREPRQSVRMYVDFLKERIPELNVAAADAYVAGYELAVYSDAEFTKDEYSMILKAWLDLKRRLDSRSAERPARRSGRA